MLEEALRLCQREKLFPAAGEAVVVAVSGGEDSMCLLDWLTEQGRVNDFSVIAAHYDHGIRPDSARDAAFVEDWCRAQGIPFYSKRGDVPAEAARLRRGLEDTARELRYRFLEALAEQLGAVSIAVAHHAEDNAETMLLHLVRGCGLNGLTGMSPKRGKLIRPLLTTPKADIKAYNLEKKIPSVLDETNADPAYTRNFLRLQVLPLLKTRNPQLTEALNRCAASLQKDNDYLEAQAEQLSAQACWEADSLVLPVSVLVDAPEVLAVRAVQQIVTRLSTTAVLNAAQRDQVLHLLTAGRGSVALGENLTVERVYDDLWFERKTAPFDPVPLAINGVTETSEWRFTTQMTTCPEGKFNQPLDFYLVPGDYLLRPRQIGDSITLPARPRKTLKKLLSDAKLPRNHRDQLPVLAGKDSVAAVTLFGADVAFLPKSGELALRVCVEKREDR